MPAVFLLIYIFLCLVLAIIGRKSMLGFPGVFIIGLLISPFVMALILMIMRMVQGNRPERQRRA